MKVTISVIKADIGSVGGHICPSNQLLHAVRAYVAEHGAKLLLDHYVSYTGDDIAIVSTHTHGPNHKEVHRLCWDAFMAGTEVAKSQGLYGAGQDPLKDCFSGNVRGMGPVPLNSGISYFDGPPILSCAAFAMHNGKMTEAIDAFAHPFWNTVREDVSRKSIGMRRQGFFGAAMLPMSELEYTGIVETLKVLDKHFAVRASL